MDSQNVMSTGPLARLRALRGQAPRLAAPAGGRGVVGASPRAETAVRDEIATAAAAVPLNRGLRMALLLASRLDSRAAAMVLFRPGWAGAHFTAPAVRLRTSCFWKITRMTTRGTNAITAPARATLIWSACWPTSCFSPICTVSSGVVPPVDTRGQRYWFQAARNANTPRAAMEGRAIGTATRVIKRQCP